MKFAILAIVLSTSAAFTGCVATDQPTTSSDDQALTSQEVEKYYFSDATFTNNIGFSDLFCSPGHVSRGKTSKFLIQFITPCAGAGGQHISCYEEDSGDENQVECPAYYDEYIVNWELD